MSEKTSLFVMFSKRIPNSINITDEFLKFNETVKGVRKPRKKSLRWLLVDFDSKEDAETVKSLLFERKWFAGIRIKHQKLSIKPTSDSSSENKRKDYLNSLSKNTFQSEKILNKFTNKLLVTQLPEDITKERLEKHFPDHLELSLKHKPHPKAVVTYSSAKEAMEARLKVDKDLDGKRIRVIILLIKNNDQEEKGFPKNPNPLKKKPIKKVEEKEKSTEKVEVPAKKKRYFEKA